MRLNYRNLTTTVALAFAVTVSCVVPSAAAPAPGKITLLEAQAGRCLDSDSHGKTYFKDCDRGNDHHQWEWTRASNDRFRIRSVGTGRCLAGSGDSIITSECDNETFNQEWYADVNGQNVYILNVSTSYYLSYSGNTVFGASEMGLPWWTPEI